MALPVLTQPEFFTNIPSSGKEIKYTPFTVKQQKALFFALESKSIKEISNAVHNIIDECVITNIKIDELAPFDIEYIFLQLRGKSIGEIIELNVKHQDPENECTHATQVNVNLDDIKVTIPDDYSNKIMVHDKIGVVISYPKFKDAEKYDNIEGKPSEVFEMLIDNIEMVFDENEVYDNFSKQELNTFVDSLGTDALTKMLDFYKKMPKLSHKIEFTCPQCGKTEEVIVEGLQSFFT